MGLRPSLIVLHYTGMQSYQSACDWLCNPQAKVSCHYLISDRGEIIQMVSEDARAWHAGVSRWHNAVDINSQSIGIEIHNLGHDGGYPDFPLTQMRSVVALCQDIVARNQIAPEYVLAHSDVAPGRKIDPGEKFDWHMLFQNGIGRWVSPLPLGTDKGLSEGATGEDVRQLQAMLVHYGYGLEVTGVYDAHTGIVVEAFQRHFRPEKVDGIADQSTVGTLKNLIAGLDVISTHTI